jgi:polyhydroxybutyrate depolymerase
MRRLLPLLFLLTACAPPAVETERLLTVPTADGTRTATVVHPDSAGPGAPLVVVLHGRGGTGADMRSLGFDDLAERDGAVVAYPQGLGRSWNAGRCCGTAQSDGVDDLGFLDELVATLVRDDGVDPRRVYAVGFSNGGHLSYAWACAGGALAGIAPVAGSLTGDCADPTPVSVLAVAGTADRAVPMAGVPSLGKASLDASLAPFVRVGACGSPTTRSDGAATLTTWDCAGGRTVTKDVITGQKHSWRAGTRDLLWQTLGIG